MTPSVVRYLVNENQRLMAKLAKVRADLEDTPDAQ